MAMNEAVSGPIAVYAVANVKRLRAERRWSLAELSARLTEVGRPILANGLNRLENDKRRISVDDLIGLAAAFDVSPVTLLLPPDGEKDIELTTTITVPARVAWDWVRARRPLQTVGTEEGDEAFETAAFERRSVPSRIRGGLQRPRYLSLAEQLGADGDDEASIAEAAAREAANQEAWREQQREEREDWTQ